MIDWSWVIVMVLSLFLVDKEQEKEKVIHQRDDCSISCVLYLSSFSTIIRPA